MPPARSNSIVLVDDEKSYTDMMKDIVAEHRTGALQLGEVSVAIAVAHPHRGAAYEASRYVIEELKKRLPVWKREHYVDGRAEWVANAGELATAARDAEGRSR